MILTRSWYLPLTLHSTLTSMICLRIFLKRIVNASDFFFRRLWPFCAPFRRAFISVKALENNEISPNVIDISIIKILITVTWLFALHSWRENVQPVFSSARHVGKRNAQKSLFPSVLCFVMFSLATKPLSGNRPRLISGLSQKEEFPDLLSLSLCHVASHLESRIDARKRHICLVFKRFTFRNEGVFTPHSLFCSFIELFVPS